MRIILSVALLLSFSVLSSFGQVSSVQDGDWDDPATWDCACVPQEADGTITILNNVLFPSGLIVTAGDVFVGDGSSGSLVINGDLTLNGALLPTEDFASPYILSMSASGSITVNASGAIDLSGLIITPFLVEGEIYNSGTISSDASVLSFEAGSFYYHRFISAGDIPMAAWNETSTCEINDLSQASPAPPNNLSQTFGNFRWNTPLMGSTTSFNLNGQLQSVTGDLTLVTSNGQAIRLNSNAVSNLSVTGNFSNQGVALILTSGAATTGTMTIDIDGSFTQSQPGSTVPSLTFAQTSGNAANITITVGGNFTRSAGTIARGQTSGTTGITFDGILPQTYSWTGTGNIATAINYSIPSGTDLDLGTSVMSGTGSLTVAGTLRVRSTHTSGAIQNTTTVDADCGNITTTFASRNFTGGTVVYQGAAAQLISAGHPSVANTVINNTNGVTFATGLTSLTFTGNLTQTLGNLSMGAGSATIIINGPFSQAGSTSLVVNANSSISIGNSGSISSLRMSGSSTINNFTLDRSGATVALLAGLTINGTFAHTNGSLDFSGFALTLAGAYTGGTGSLLFNSTSTLMISGSGTIAALPFGSSTIGTFVLNNSNGASSSAGITIQTLINLQSGAFTGAGGVTMANVSSPYPTFQRSNGSTTKAVNTAGSYHVDYNATGIVTPGNELPTGATALRDLSISPTLNLNKNITVNGIFTVRSTGTFNAGANTVVIKGNYVLNGSADFETATLQFGGTTTLSGSADPNFNNFTVNTSSSLNLGVATTIYISGNITNNGTITGGSSTIVFDGNTTLDGGGTTTTKGSFNNIEITGIFQVTCAICSYPSQRWLIDVAGNFTIQVGGTFNENQSIVRLTGTTAQSIAMQGQNFFDLQLQGSNTVTLTEDLTVSEDLTIGQLATLDTGPGSQTITMGDDMTINGTFVPNFGRVTFSGSATQSIGRTGGTSTINFYSIRINKPASTIFNFDTPINVMRSIDFLALSGAYTVDFDGAATSPQITFLSDPVTGRTGQILRIPDNVTVQGEVNMQRFMEPAPSQARIFRYISSPLNAVPVSRLQDDFPITGTFTGNTTCAAFTPGARNMYYYNEPTTGNSNNGYVGFPTANVTETMTSGRGFAVQMCDGASTIVWDVFGTVRRATTSTPFSFPINYTNTGLPNDDGLNLVGNPFPCALDWEASGWTKTNVTNTFWIRNNRETNIASYNGDLNTGTNGATQYIALGQAFWIQATAGSPALSMTEDVKVDNQAEFFRVEPLSDLLRISVNHKEFNDEIIIHLDDRADDASNTFGDSRKFMSEFVNLSSFTEDSVRLSINSLSQFTCNRTVGLALEQSEPGDYAFSFNGFESFENTNVILIDRWEGVSKALKPGDVYTFAVTDDANSFGRNRFQVSLTRGQDLLAVNAVANEVCAGNVTEIEITDAQAGVSYYVTSESGDVLTKKITATKAGSLNLPVSLTAGTHEITVMADNNGCQTLPVASITSVVVLQKPTIKAPDAAFTCGTGAVNLKVESDIEATGFHWYAAETDEYAIVVTNDGLWTTPELNASTTYYVAAENRLGCIGNRLPVKAEVRQQPSGTIVKSSNILSTQSTGDISWYYNDEVVGNEMSFTARNAGAYTLNVTSNGCESVSTIMVEARELSESDRMQITPNPATEFVNMLIYSTSERVQVEMISTTGTSIETILLSETTDNEFQGKINLEGQASGMYILKILEDNRPTYKRVIKK